MMKAREFRGLFAICILRGDSKICIFSWKYTVSVVYNLLNYKNIFTALKKQPALVVSIILRTFVDGLPRRSQTASDMFSV